jgi:hypothetical protein
VRPAASYPVGGELFTPDPAKQIGWTQKRGRQLTKCGKYPITGTVPESVIDALEAIEIKQKKGGRLARKTVSDHQPFARLEKATTVRNARQWINQRGALVARGNSILDETSE